jgi:hypothetical protein
MIIFLNDDRAYLSWVTHHRGGFVLDGRRRPRLTHLLIHRATCAEVKQSADRRSHLTTAGRLKACAATVEELQHWAVEETEKEPDCCEKCQPNQTLPVDEAETAHLTKFAAEILDYVVEAAAIHLEHEHPPYRVTVGDIGACFAKTPGQLSVTLHHLVQDGYIILPGASAKDAPFPSKRLVLPTAKALRTLEAFRTASNDMLQAELAKLHPE